VGFTGATEGYAHTKADSDFQDLWDAIQQQSPHALADWLKFYNIPASPSSFGAPTNTRIENRDLGSLDTAEFDIRNFAVSPDLRKGLPSAGSFSDLAECAEDEIGFEDSHDIVMYDFVDSSTRRVHFKGLARSTDDLFWLDGHRFVLLGAENTGQ